MLGTSLILAGVVLGIFLYGLRKLSTDPPNYGVITWFGERTGGVIKEGWHWFLLPQFVQGFVPVDMTAKNQDFLPEDIRTPDMAEIKIEAAITFRPDPKNLINYLNVKGEAGVRQILDDVVEEAIRERAANPLKDPKTWEEAVKMKDVFIAEVAATIKGQNVDTMQPDELKKLALELRRGNGNVEIETLGIVLSRVNVKSIKPTGELAQAAEQVAKELREMQAEKVEIDNVGDRIKELAEKSGISPELAVEVVQTERKKVTKDIKQIKLDAGSVVDAVGKFLSGFRKP